MNTKTKIMIPAFAAAFAMIFAITPMVMADNGGHAMWSGERQHKHGQDGILIDGFAGSIQIPANVTAGTKDSLKSQITVTLGQAVSAAETKGFTDAERASIGVANDGQGNKYLVWTLTNTNRDATSGIVTVNTFIVDAGNAANSSKVTTTFDPSTMGKGMWGDKAEKFGDFKQKFSEPTGNAEIDAARAHFLELKQQLVDANKNGDTETANTIKGQLQELKQTLHSLTHPAA